MVRYQTEVGQSLGMGVTAVDMDAAKTRRRIEPQLA
jgi:hypothetical protein